MKGIYIEQLDDFLWKVNSEGMDYALMNYLSIDRSLVPAEDLSLIEDLYLVSELLFQTESNLKHLANKYNLKNES